MKKYFSILYLLVLVGGFFPPVVSYASCPCYCGTTTGIVGLGNKTSPEECASACASTPDAVKMEACVVSDTKSSSSGSKGSTGSTGSKGSTGSTGSKGSTGSTGSSSGGAASPAPKVTTIEKCQCFCATESGAKDIGQKKILDCKAECEKSGDTVSVCAYKPAQYPDRNLRCFSKEECKAQGGIRSTRPSRDCPSGKPYCYPDPAKQAKLTLQVKIGKYDVAANLGEYLNVVYKWLMIAGTTIAIVMIMVGGLQYVLGSGSGDSAAGKKRINNAVIGLVLLFCTYLILFTVNPYLVRLNVPQLPMIKQVILPNITSCEDMVKAGYEVDVGDKEKKCGTIGKVKKAPEGKSVPDGTTCDFVKCPSAGEKCLGSGDKAKCLTCTSDLSKAGVTPSSEVCSKLTPPEIKAGEYIYWQKCGVTWAPQLVSKSISAKIIGTAKTLGAKQVASYVQKNHLAECSLFGVMCNGIKKCEDYTTNSYGKGFSSDGPVLLKNVGAGLGEVDLKSICQQNPCKAPGSCVAEIKGIASAAASWSSLIPGVVLYDIATGMNELRCVTH